MKDGTIKFRAKIQLNGKATSLGLFLTPEEAKVAYDEAAGQLHGSFSRT